FNLRQMWAIEEFMRQLQSRVAASGASIQLWQRASNVMTRRTHPTQGDYDILNEVHYTIFARVNNQTKTEAEVGFEITYNTATSFTIEHAPPEGEAGELFMSILGRLP